MGTYLVGSRARGDFIEEGNTDIVLVVDRVRTLSALERLYLAENLLKLKMNIMAHPAEE